MERNREGRRANMVAAAANGLSRRRHRVGGSLRDSPEEDAPVELQETVRLRDRKKDRDRDRDRTHSKRKRNDRLTHGDESTEEESLNDDEEDDEDERMLPPNPATSGMYSSSSLSNHHSALQNQHQHHQNPLQHPLQHRKSYPPVTSAATAAVTGKVFRPAQPWKAADEMIGVSVVVPRKARSASTKRSHECWNSNSGGGGVAGDQTHRQASTSPARPNLVSTMSPSPVSPPSSSTISIKKKMKSNGSKHRPPPLKSSSKSSSSNQEEIEIAEVLYGMMRQPQGPSKQEIMETKFDPRESNKTNTTTGDAKSRVSSPISNSQSVAAPPQPGFLLSHNSSSSSAPMTAVGPKRKKPRPVSYTDEGSVIFASRSNPMLSITKTEVDQSAKIGTLSPNLEKNSGSVIGNGVVGYEFNNAQFSQASYESQPDSAVKAENRSASSDSMLLTEELEDALKEEDEEEAQSPKNEALRNKFDENSEDSKANFVKSGVEAKREEKFQIDLMAPPFQTRSSPEREAEINFSIGPKQETERRFHGHEDEKTLKLGRDDNSRIPAPVEKKDEVESQKTIVNKDRFMDLQLDLHRNDNDNFSGNKISQNATKHHPLQQKFKASRDEPANAQSSGSLPLSISMANWPGGLPPMGYMSPLQGVVSMDGANVSSATLQPPQVHFSQPRPKRCATHCYIARNIHCHQQYARMNPFWPAPAICKAANLTAMPMPSSELHGNSHGKSVNSLPDNKGPSIAMFHGHPGKDNKGSSQAAHIVDAAQRKQQQILLQQAIPQGAPNNILHGPAFLFPLNQPQAVAAAAAAAASVRPGSFKATITGSSVQPTVVSNSASLSGSATAAVGPTAMSFNYPNMPNTDTQYLVLQNNGYPFPIPTHVGGSQAAAAYRGTHAQAVPFFNGSFYSSQILHHPSQLQQQQQQQFQQQQQQQQPPPPQTQHQGHQNASISSGSSSSQKQHLHNLQQQRPQGTNGGIINSGSFSATKSKPSSQQQLQSQQQQQSQRLQLPPHQSRQLEAEVGGEDSPSTADSRVSQSRPNMGVYGQNFAMPIHPQNFALLTHPVSMSGNGSSSNPTEKKQQQQPSPAFAMSFASFSDTSNSPGIDMSSMAQNQAILQTFPEAARQGYQHMLAAAHTNQMGLPKKPNRTSEDAKNGGGDSSTNAEDERKKAQTPGGQSIAFSRSDLSETNGSTIPGSTVIDSSSRGLSHVSASARASQLQPLNSSSSQQQQQQLRLQQQQQHHMQHQHQMQHQQQQQQMLQIQKQQAQYVARNKLPATTSSPGVYSDQVSVKFSNALSATFPQNLVQSSGSPSSQSSSQWKESARTNPSAQAPSSSMATASSTTSSLKNLPQQQQSRTQSQQTHTQISFAGNLKSSSTPPQPQQQQPSNITNQAPSPPMAVGSPTTSSISNKGNNSGSPRTATSTYTSIKPSQAASTLSPQQGKSAVSAPRKSSPVGGRTVPSILGNPHINNSSSGSGGSKPQVMVQQQQQNQLPKQAMQQAQLYFSNSYMQQTQGGPNSINTAYAQRRRPEQQQQQQQTQGSSTATSSSSGMLLLSQPATLPNGSSTSDPAKAVATANAATSVNNTMKAGGGIQQSQSQTMRNTAQFAAASQHPVPPGFSYVHAVPTPVQVKPVEQKQPPGD